MRRTIVSVSLAAVGLLLSGCYGFSHNPSYFPFLKLPGDIVRTHGKPPGLGYYANFDPHAVRVEVRPLEAVSPVRQHYVVLATVYDEKGQPRRNRRVEWMLEGVGNIIEVDESGCAPGRGYKVDNHYAVSYTNYFTHRVSRGNNDPNDDFQLRPGQTWCVISSAVEGDTQLTVYCPEIHNWEANKVVVTTHWVDAEWSFPPGSIARSGGEQVLTTTVVRSSDRQPLAGYRVRYRILDGPPAYFLPGRTQEAVAVSDLRGAAPVALVQAAPVAGVNRIGVEIIRAPDPSKTSDAGLVLARGETTCEWQAPVITLDVTAPPAVVIGQDLPLTITLGNTGQVETRAITVRAAVPEGLQLLRSDPPVSAEGGQLVWTLGELGGKQARTLQVVFRTSRLGLVSFRVSATTAEGMTGEKGVTTQVTPEPQAQLKVSVSGPAEVAAGGPVTVEIKVTNPGSAPATGVKLSAAFGAGLEHESKANPVETAIGTLASGETRTALLTLAAREPGPQEVRVTATAAGGLTDGGRHTVTVRRAALALRNTGPLWRYAGRPAEWSIEVRNDGELPLTKVVVRDALPPELEFHSASDGGVLEGNQVVWTVGALQPGEQKVLKLTTVCRQLTKAAQTVATATAEGGVQVQAPAAVEVRGLPALRMRVVDRDDPVEAGGKTAYTIEVSNTGSLPAGGVRVDAVVPEQMRVLETTGTAAGKVEGQKVAFPPVESLAPGQTLSYTIQVQAMRPGVAYFRAEMSAQTLTQPVVEEESTIVLAAPGGGR